MIKKTIIVIFLLIAVVLAATFVLTACSPKESFDVVFTDNVKMNRLEFVTGVYNRNQPTLFYFHGLTDSADLTSLVRPSQYDDVLDEGESNQKLSLKSNLADYWKGQNWNVALFHYEGQTSGGEDKFFEELFLDDAVLSEFINVYRLYFKEQAVEFDSIVGTGSMRSVQEIRFAGDSVGANFAAYAAESISRLVDEGRLSQFYLPWRVTLLNPHLNNKTFSSALTSIGAGASALEGVTRAVETAARLGNVVGELVESDMRYATSYQNPYSEQDTKTYDRLLSRVATMEINETFSTTADWSPSLKETISKVWYLATIGGSDYDSTGNSSVPSTMKNLLPFINAPKENYNNALSFSVSAWTPTAYIRGLQGLCFRSTDINSSETPKYKERVITKFRLELFASSDKTQTKPRIGGYLFVDLNGDLYMNDGRKSVMREGIPVRMRYTVSGREETTMTTYTQYDGYYMFEIPKEAYNYAVYLDYEIPDFRYLFGGKDTSGKTNDELCSMAAANGTMQFVSSNWKDVYNMNKNCGYRLAEPAVKA